MWLGLNGRGSVRSGPFKYEPMVATGLIFKQVGFCLISLGSTVVAHQNPICNAKYTSL